MKKFMFFFFIFAAFFDTGTRAEAAETLAERLRGRILLQVESYGRAWYVNPADGTRYYLKDGETAFELMRSFGLGITDRDLAKIPIARGQAADRTLAARLSGRILLQVEKRGEAWYVNPSDGLRYYLQDGNAAYALMRQFGLGIKDKDLRKIEMNDVQIVQDTTFDDVAYVKLSGGDIVAEKHQNQILPPASLTKLMTALVLIDHDFDFHRTLTLTADALAFPKALVGDDTTSEIELEAGDQVQADDLFIAMLVASSNQAAIALVDASGMTREEFIAAMNARAKAMGLTRTRFFDPAGLDAHTVTTPYEMALIAQEAFLAPEIFAAARQDAHTITMQQPPYRSLFVTDRNTTLKPYHPDAVKVGFLIEAQRCVALMKDGDIVVIMHARSMSERNGILNKLLSRE
ncbi:MAG: serine hydrolase [Patescibacteria group bacterium]